MGFTTGFTGGVTVTLGVAYLTVLAHQRNRETQSHILRSQTHVLSSVLEPQVRIPPPLTRSEQAVKDRETLLSTAKDRWNREVENAVRWAQRTDWTEVREVLESGAARLWGGAIDKAGEAEQAVENKAVPLVKEASARGAAFAEEKGESARKEARSAWDRAREKSLAAEEAARAKAAEARKYVDEKAAEVKVAVGEAVEKGKQQGEAVLVAAQQAAGVAEDKVSVKADGKVLPAASPVQRALHQRYEKPSGLTKSVKEALAERYQRVDERDNTQLRGI
ncbi:hypothetical protein ColTof4_00861 [Colletotrichum tofieldiae]|uniref:MICOS complex subunit MIC12 n=1 Tax=Colletotrichum tofieldiae TaxID=708197 RepID=A0A161WH89_9PEZI|nr:hypothetical protein CT0861_11117 [Colletotrichum tofieldiae]GKT60736.1 hypothetical protein ColTof3_08075 [Colletotrichum tofieldiae]GKT68438.1 hypothetical protein ColTof4_00861 [Colletotrichum tofieldiae]GKT90544.1 hypothetical protein Ct61P_08394 [Colletotrichum tofieldiae]